MLVFEYFIWDYTIIEYLPYISRRQTGCKSLFVLELLTMETTVREIVLED